MSSLAGRFAQAAVVLGLTGFWGYLIALSWVMRRREAIDVSPVTEREVLQI